MESSNSEHTERTTPGIRRRRRTSVHSTSRWPSRGLSTATELERFQDADESESDGRSPRRPIEY